MALQIDLATSQYGVPFNGAYFRIVTANIQRTREPERRFVTLIDIVGYAARPTDEDTRDVDFRRYHVETSVIDAQVGDTWLGKCYTWVAAQPDFAGCVGV
jgi:hypothetical protein